MIRHLIARAFIAFFGLLLAGVAAGAFLVVAIFGWSLVAPFAGGPPEAAVPSLMFLSFTATVLVGTLAFTPAAITVAIAEILALRSWVFYALAGMGCALFGLEGSGFETGKPDPRLLIAAAGAVGGLVYWAFAGRRAGEGISRGVNVRRGPEGS